MFYFSRFLYMAVGVSSSAISPSHNIKFFAIFFSSRVLKQLGLHTAPFQGVCASPFQSNNLLLMSSVVNEQQTSSKFGHGWLVM